MKWIKNLFRIKSGRSDKLSRFKVAPFALTLDQWQRNEQLVSEMAKVSATPIWRAMMQVMNNECPSGIKLEQVGTLITDRAALQAQTEGYRMAINNLEAMSALVAVDEVQEATFAPEQQQ